VSALAAYSRKLHPGTLAWDNASDSTWSMTGLQEIDLGGFRGVVAKGAWQRPELRLCLP